MGGCLRGRGYSYSRVDSRDVDAGGEAAGSSDGTIGVIARRASPRQRVRGRAGTRAQDTRQGMRPPMGAGEAPPGWAAGDSQQSLARAIVDEALSALPE